MPDPCIAPTNATINLDVDDLGRLTGEVKRSTDAGQGLEQRASGLWARGRPLKVSQFPASPNDGDRVLLVTADPNVVLEFEYDAPLSMWLPRGGGELYAVDSTTFNVTTTTYAGSTVSITLPAAGTWDIDLGGDLGSPADGTPVYLSVQLDGATTLDGNAAVNYNTRTASVMTSLRKADANGLSVAGRVITLKRRVPSGTGTIFKQWMRARPVACHA